MALAQEAWDRRQIKSANDSYWRSGGHNLASATTTVAHYGPWASGEDHAEELVIQRLSELGIPKCTESVLTIFTQRCPCSLPGYTCLLKLTHWLQKNRNPG